MMSVLEGELCWLRTRRRDAQLPGAARDRLLRALAGTAISGLNMGLFGLEIRILLLLSLLRSGSGWNWWVSDDSSGRAFIPDISWSFCRSSQENDSSAKFDIHSSSANSSNCKMKQKKKKVIIIIFHLNYYEFHFDIFELLHL